MTQDNQKARDHQRHISMELTADEARVTSLSLRGSRLILTIEAELADSQLRATDDDQGGQSHADTRPVLTRAAAPAERRTDTEFIHRPPQSADAPAIGLAVSEDVSPGVLALGSENLPPAPSAAFAPPPKSMTPAPSMTIDPAHISSPGEPGLSIAPMSPLAAAPAPTFAPEPVAPAFAPEPAVPAFAPEPAVPSFAPLGLMPEPSAPERPVAPAPAAPAPGPAGDLAAIRGPGPEYAPPRRDADPDATVPAASLGVASAPPFAPTPAPRPSDSARQLRLDGDDAGAPIPALTPAPPSAPAPAAELRLGGDDELSPAGEWGGGAPSPRKTPPPAVETWDPGSFGLEGATPAFGEPLAMAEDSSAVGGERHGEPQPAIAFGSDALPSLEPAPAPLSASAAAPDSIPLALEPMRPIGFEAPSSSPFAPPPAPPPPPAPGPMTPPAIAFADAPPASSPGSLLSPDDVPTQMAMPSPLAEPKREAPKQQETPAPRVETPPPEGKPEGKSEGGGTTVLIRYTCPKCKTQGMQAVDKVGTVVNCSNCGKAMRLVMKK